MVLVVQDRPSQQRLSLAAYKADRCIFFLPRRFDIGRRRGVRPRPVAGRYPVPVCGRYRDSAAWRPSPIGARLRWRLVNLASLEASDVDRTCGSTKRRGMPSSMVAACAGRRQLLLLSDRSPEWRRPGRMASSSRCCRATTGRMPGSIAVVDGARAEDCARLWSYLVEGGETNMARFAGTWPRRWCRAVRAPEAAETLAKAGIWWPGEGCRYRRRGLGGEASTPACSR